MELRIIKSRRTFQKSSHGPRFTTDCQQQNSAVFSLLLTVTGRKKPSPWGSAHCRIAKNGTKGLDSVQSLLHTASDRTTVFSLLLTVTGRKKSSPWGSAHCRNLRERAKSLDSVQSLLQTASDRTRPLSIHAVSHHENGTGSLRRVLSLLHTSSGRPKPVDMYVMSHGNKVPNVSLHRHLPPHSVQGTVSGR